MPIELEMTLRILLAAALGAIIGFQRARAGKPAGIRTHSLICLGAALFSVVSTLGFISADPSRIAAGVVTGIGFLGAGAIIHREGGLVGGLTTAATIWAVAAIGLAAGIGMYIIATVASVIVLAVLILPHPSEG
jgi:putative Mg2+ transporter-C (MgtC) family protein